jgi:hypothetical protein
MSRIVFRFLFVAILVIMSAAAFGHSPARAAGPWYVANGGADGNDCLSPTTPCATINGALAKPGFLPGDTVRVAIGTYTGTGNEVVLLTMFANLSGGWDAAFTAQSGMSTLDGQGVRRGLSVFGGSGTVEAFIIQNGTLFNTGGGIYNSGTLTLTKSIVRGNAADFGAGISNAGTLTLNDSTVSGNTAATFGGGILNNGPLTLNNSTVSGNMSIEFGGGGIANSGGVLILNNSTVSGNSTPDNGGGILNAGGPVGTVTLNYTTVSNNSADIFGGGIANFNSTGTVTLGSSIVAGNRIGLSGFDHPQADCFTDLELVTLGYNLVGSGSGCFIFGAPGDVSVTTSFVFTHFLNPLADNGGPTQTHALIPGPINSALDAIPSGTNNCGSAPFDADQRGVARPQGAQCDRGAFEWQETGGGEDVTIDILPGSTANIINLRSRGTVPVAILSTTDFDARTMVDRTSLTFGAAGDETSLASCNNKGSDVNHDGLLDLVCQFHIQLTGFQPHHVLGILKGNIVGGTPFEAADTVRIVKK